MADFAKRSEVTIETMGRVNNPTGAGVRATSTQVQARRKKMQEREEESDAHNIPDCISTTTVNNGIKDNSTNTATALMTDGSSRRNIVRKHTADAIHRYDSSHKKQGGHGKGLWKREIGLEDGEYYQDAAVVLDESDPLYMASEDSKYILTSHGGTLEQARGVDPSTRKQVYGPLLTLQEFKVQVSDCLLEYLQDSNDADEVIRCIQELACPEYYVRVLVKRVVSLALDMGPRQREWASRLLTCLHPVPMSEAEMQAGFQVLLDGMEDLSKDVPDAVNMVACFLARAVVDEVLPPAFLSQENDARPGDAVVARAISLLNREHATARLEKIWGPGDGRPVAELKQDMDQLLQEYLASRELDEAARCVKELDAKHFHHELVKRGVMCAMELDGASHCGGSKGKNGAIVANGDKHVATTATDNDDELSNLDAMAALFGFLVSNAIVSENQVMKGVVRLHHLLDDIKLDVPSAPILLESFEKMAMEQGCLPTTGVSSSELAKIGGAGASGTLPSAEAATTTAAEESAES
ncbi:hypothetical protein MPSEU_000670200 [Mayamaea pseudoterrestris]|nr:hypothetical protein MPSEU_000670200 [Mayamaea pseudoterrestris]